LLLNHGQHYSIQIEANTAVESFCLFFAPGLAETVRHTLTMPDQHLLDAPTTDNPITFFEKTYPHDDILTPFLERLRITYATSGTGRLEENFHELMARLLQVHFNIYREIEMLPAARPTTREELYRRVHCARDYIAALYHKPITLDDIAAVACLSPNHLLRSFKHIFGSTPHQFITALRLEEAQRLLRNTEISVTEVCFAVGFESLGTFSWLFRRRFGVSPRQYRQKIG
jgi:AraC-like DNA-binding protein